MTDQNNDATTDATTDAAATMAFFGDAIDGLVELGLPTSGVP